MGFFTVLLILLTLPIFKCLILKSLKPSPSFPGNKEGGDVAVTQRTVGLGQQDANQSQPIPWIEFPEEADSEGGSMGGSEA